MSTEEIYTYRFSCDELGSCSEDRTITVQAVDVFAAAHDAQKQGWLVRPAFYVGAEDWALCPQHFAEAVLRWRNVGYNPSWLQRHPFLVPAGVVGNQP